LLGLWYERGSVLVFVDKQEKCDQLFQELLKLGYPCLSLHGGKDQVDRDHTLHEFKTGIKTVMIATSVAGRGLDVPDIVCVINYNCPNHIEDYVHRVGRTGRAGRKGTAYTFISQREDQYAPSMVKVLQKAGQEPPAELAELAKQFKEKVARGEAHWGASGFEGKGFTFDASELNETQKVASMQKKAYEREQGIMAADAGDEADDEDDDGDVAGELGPITGAGAGAVAGALVPAVGGAAGAVAAPPPAPTPPVITADMTPLERARAIAASIAANKAAAAAAAAAAAGSGTVIPAAATVLGASASGGVVGPTAASAGPVDAAAALARAKLLAVQLAAGKGIATAAGAAGGIAGAGGNLGTSGVPATEYFSDELEINDYPHQVHDTFLYECL
jgi:ATP-dependent RNA helicase DDX46/PRP5